MKILETLLKGTMEMKKILAVLTILILAAPMSSAVTIVSITANNALTQFTASTGHLSMSSTNGIIQYDTSNSALSGTFQLDLYRQTDLSSGGIAQAAFLPGGTFTFKDAGSNNLLAGSVSAFNLIEVFNGSGMLAGQGSFTVTGGSLQTAFGSTGNIVNISFFAPTAISDFSSMNFSAVSNFTVTSIPEPVTITIIGLGAMSVLKKRRNA